jgi:hypothetical protein
MRGLGGTLKERLLGDMRTRQRQTDKRTDERTMQRIEEGLGNTMRSAGKEKGEKEKGRGRDYAGRGRKKRLAGGGSRRVFRKMHRS